MTDLNYDDAPFAIRDDLTTAHRGAVGKVVFPRNLADRGYPRRHHRRSAQCEGLSDR